jgi:hypothetical protein
MKTPSFKVTSLRARGTKGTNDLAMDDLVVAAPAHYCIENSASHAEESESSDRREQRIPVTDLCQDGSLLKVYQYQLEIPECIGSEYFLLWDSP